MDAQIINALLAATGSTLKARLATPVNSGRPFSREAPLTPYEYNVLITVKADQGRPLEVLISSPAATADALVGSEEGADDDTRLAALSELAHAAIAKAVGPMGPAQVTTEQPRAVLGWDVVVPSLRSATRRLCIPFNSSHGGLVVEAGVHVSPV